MTFTFTFARLWHVGFDPSGCAYVPPWVDKSRDAFINSVSVGGLCGSNCLMRLTTVGVYGAAGSSGGDVFGAGSTTGREYGTADRC